MFDAVLHGNQVPSRWGWGATLTVLAHVVVIGAVIELRTMKPKVEKEAPAVVFVKPVAPAPPPPPPPPPAPKKTTQTHVVKQIPKEVIVQPKEIPKEPPKEEPAPPEESSEPEGVVGGVVGGVAGGVVGGTVGGVVGGTLGGTGHRLEFSDKMAPPKKVSGPDPEYNQQALDREIQGTMLVKCVVTIEGEVKECRVLKSLPFLEKTVLDALLHRRYTPALLDGRPVEVEYTFKIPFVLPEE